MTTNPALQTILRETRWVKNKRPQVRIWEVKSTKSIKNISVKISRGIHKTKGFKYDTIY